MSVCLPVRRLGVMRVTIYILYHLLDLNPSQVRKCVSVTFARDARHRIFELPRASIIFLELDGSQAR